MAVHTAARKSGSSFRESVEQCPGPGLAPFLHLAPQSQGFSGCQIGSETPESRRDCTVVIRTWVFSSLSVAIRVAIASSISSSASTVRRFAAAFSLSSGAASVDLSRRIEFATSNVFQILSRAEVTNAVSQHFQPVQVIIAHEVTRRMKSSSRCETGALDSQRAKPSPERQPWVRPRQSIRSAVMPRNRKRSAGFRVPRTSQPAEEATIEVSCSLISSATSFAPLLWRS